MSVFQIVMLVFAALMVYLFIKRKISSSSVKNYSADEVKEKIKSSRNIILLDVRTNSERKSRSISGSLHIPLGELSSRLSELNKYKDKEIVVYCASGGRSVTGAGILSKNNFNAANLIGGISGW